MSRPCPDPLRILAQGEALGADDRKHLETCRECQEALREMRRITLLLNDLGQAEVATQAPDRAWPGVASRLEDPGLLSRLPMPLAGVSRLAQEVLKPAVAAAWAVGVVGLLLGIWLAPRSPAVQPEEAYTWSSLVEDRGSLSAVYESSFAGDASDVQSRSQSETPAPGDDSSGTEWKPEPGGQP